MAITNQQRVGKGLELLRQGLSEFVQREFESTYGNRAQIEAQRFLGTESAAG